MLNDVLQNELMAKYIRTEYERSGLTWAEFTEYYNEYLAENAWGQLKEGALRKRIQSYAGKVEELDENDTSIGAMTTVYNEDNEPVQTNGTLVLDKFPQLGDAKEMMDIIYKELNLDPEIFFVERTTVTSTTNKDGARVNVTIKRRKDVKQSISTLIERYEQRLEKMNSLPPIIKPTLSVSENNLAVFNLCDIHWNKMPATGYNNKYLDEFEASLYKAVVGSIEKSKALGSTKAIIVLGSDFFQTNDARGTTKRGTLVDHVLPYAQMYESGMVVLANIVKLIASEFPEVEAYYVLANHDETSAWHAVRELKHMFSQTEHLKIHTNFYPYNYITHGSSIIELVHENMKGSRGNTQITNLAREEFGKSRFAYSIGGHLHGRYFAKEDGGINVIGSKSPSDSDMWHTINGYLGNDRAIETYIFSEDSGLISNIIQVI